MPVGAERLAGTVQSKPVGGPECGRNCGACPLANRCGAITPSLDSSISLKKVAGIKEILTNLGELGRSVYIFEQPRITGGVGGGPTPTETSKKACSKCEKDSTSCTCFSK